MELEIEIDAGVTIPAGELWFTASRSSGPGGQNVNKVNTRVTLHFDVVNSQSLSEHQKTLILERLAGRISRAGLLRVVSQKHRSQAANREEATKRFAMLLGEALCESRPRKKLSVPRKAKERRLEEKKYRSRVKERRSKVVSEDD